MKLLACVLSLGLVFGSVGSANAQQSSAPAPDSNVQQDPLMDELVQVQSKVMKGEWSTAVMDADVLIAKLRIKYNDADTVYYSAGSPEEALMYLLIHASRLAKGEKVKSKAVDTGIVWGTANFLKAYAMAELNDLDGARKAINEATELSPMNAHFHNESGEIAKRAKDWDSALQSFKTAEEWVSTSPDESQAAIRARARRGQAYSLIELGRYSEAETVLKKAIKDDPNDAAAKSELEYLRSKR